MKTILLLGKNGQVGWELQRALQPLGCVIALDRHPNADGLCGDLTNPEAITQAIHALCPDIVVNAAAYTAVDKAESERDISDSINHHAVHHLAEQCYLKNSLLVHYSTDYVFDGSGSRPWVETDTTAPVNEYGKSKRNGEISLENSGVRFLNFRTSWVYGTHGNNFIKTMLRVAKDKTELNIINDQIGAPTGAALIADITAHCLHEYFRQPEKQTTLHGHYHLAAGGETSWYDYARFIFDHAAQRGAALKIEKMQPIPTTAYPTPAKRPLNSRLNTNKLRAAFHLHLPDWQQGVAQTIDEILESTS